MPQVQPAESGNFRAYTKTAGDEPLPGYKLIAPLGRGGFGEVWRCEAPGGLHKAVKFVTSHSEDGRGHERLGQELAAFQQIKAIRHPFLLTLERVEQIDGELVMVMELADRQLQDRFNECRTCGLPGLPREELLSYFADAAEALDVIEAKFHLQHLDIKPANLFIVSGHAKVGDYGLVAQLEGPGASNRGLTPRYVAPEVLHGAPSNRSDQYSLALVYHELLTGEFPYPGKTPQQLMLQHVSGTPNLAALPAADQQAVARALAKRPDERYPSCLAFVQALMAAAVGVTPAAAMSLRRARVDRSLVDLTPLPPALDAPSGNSSLSARSTSTQPAPGQSLNSESAQKQTLPDAPPSTVTGAPRSALPPLNGAGKPELRTPRPSAGSITPPPPAAAVEFDALPMAEEEDAGRVVLKSIRSVVPLSTLLGQGTRETRLDSLSFAAAVVQAAAEGGQAPQMPGDVGRLPDGTWACRFPSTVPNSVVALKMEVVRDKWGVSIESDDDRVLMRRTAGGGGRLFGGKKFGYEVEVVLPKSGKLLDEFTVLGRLFGTPDQRFARESLDLLPKFLQDVRAQLGNVPDRRKHPRVACELAARLYPIHSDGGIDAAVNVTCRDVSLGGIGLSSRRSLKTKYAYACFPDVAGIETYAALIRLIRGKSGPDEKHYGAQYRADL